MIYGIITGCDKNQEWLLPWWWKHYIAHNSYPVAFIDFGMSEKGKAWCRKKGIYLPLLPTKAHITGKNHLSLEKRLLWEGHYGEKIWSRRRIWFKKPFALLQSPFPFSLWLDLDCQVRKPLEPLFNCLHFGLEIAVKKDREEIQQIHREKQFIRPEESNYDCGLIAFQQNAPILRHWTDEITHRNAEYVFDQQALSRALIKHNTPLLELPPLYNWSVSNGPNQEALIYHFHGGALKEMIKAPPPNAFWL